MAGTCGGNGTSAAVFHHSELHLLTHFSSCYFLSASPTHLLQIHVSWGTRLVIFCVFFTQIFRHKEVYHLEKCIWWHISHNGLVFSCVCVSIGFCKKCILYYNFALGYLHFAKNSFLENFFGKLAKPWKEKSLWHIFCRNHFQPSFLNSQVANFVFLLNSCCISPPEMGETT